MSVFQKIYIGSCIRRIIQDILRINIIQGVKEETKQSNVEKFNNTVEGNSNLPGHYSMWTGKQTVTKTSLSR